MLASINLNYYLFICNIKIDDIIKYVMLPMDI